MERFYNYLGNIDELVKSSPGVKKDEYIHPALKNIGCVSLVLIREAIAPVVFRNSEQEITDIEFEDETYVRAVPNKFKYPERGRGLQILRYYDVGGRLPQNRTVLKKGQKPSEAFDMNTLVFGDSSMQENKVFPVRAGVNYSDGLSLLPKHLCVDESFHIQTMEDGTLFDAESEKNSENLFTRHFIAPETLMIQVLSTRGKVLPCEGLDHLLLCMGIAGAYGGQTSTTGVNIHTHIAGLYASRFERPETSPYELVKALNVSENPDIKECNAVIRAVHDMLEKKHEVSMDSETASNYQNQLVRQFEEDSAALREKYEKAAPKIARLFDSWFGTGKEK